MHAPFDEAPFYPPRIAPSANPLRFPLNLIKLLVNNLEIIPEQAYHEPVVLAPGPPRVAFFTGTEVVKTLLFDRPADFPKGRLQVETLKPTFGNAMISCEGREWRWQRSAAAPLFRYDELLRYGETFRAAAEATIARWRAAPPGTVHPIHTDMLRAAFHVITNTMLVGGAPELLAAIEKGHADYYDAANWWVVYALLGLPERLPRPGGRKMRAHQARLRAAVTDVVRARRAGAADGDDLLGRLVRSSDPETGQSMSDELVVNNIIAFLMAGNDTMAFSLIWTLYLLAKSPAWEARMLREIDDVAGTGPVTAAHVAQLVTVQQVLNESMRLFPTAPVIIRDIVEDMEFDGVKIPAGTVGIIPIYAIHRHHSYWEDPHRFDPSRFTPDRATKRSRFQFLPFGAGPRICIGNSFSMIEGTLMLAEFVRAARFETEPGFDPQPCGRVFLVPKRGMPLRVTMREHAA
jgi:cytochrome P450